MQNAECSEQMKTVDNCFYRSECAETRSNGSKACPCEQDDYVSRVGAEAECRIAIDKAETKCYNLSRTEQNIHQGCVC